jgi:hypothetical protein
MDEPPQFKSGDIVRYTFPPRDLHTREYVREDLKVIEYEVRTLGAQFHNKKSWFYLIEHPNGARVWRAEYQLSFKERPETPTSTTVVADDPNDFDPNLRLDW